MNTPKSITTKNLYHEIFSGLLSSFKGQELKKISEETIHDRVESFVRDLNFMKLICVARYFKSDELFVCLWPDFDSVIFKMATQVLEEEVFSLRDFEWPNLEAPELPPFVPKQDFFEGDLEFNETSA